MDLALHGGNLGAPPEPGAASHCAGVFNVADYGAKGDGRTDDAAAINKAISAAAAGGTVCFPIGRYLIGAQIRVNRSHLAIVGSPGVTIQIKAATTLEDGPAGLPTAIYVTGNDVWLDRFRFDGAKSLNGQTIAGIAAVGADFRATDLEVFNCQGDVRLGAGIRLDGVGRGWLSRLHVHNNNSNGIHLFGGTRDVVVAECDTQDNGIIGLEIEGVRDRRPSAITVSNVVASGNAAANLSLKLADDVTVHGLVALGGGNDGSVKIIFARRVTIAEFCIRHTMPGAQSPHGIWVQQEADPGGASECIVLGPGIVSHLGEQATPGDGIRIEDAVDGLTMVGVQSVSNWGHGLSVIGTYGYPTSLKVLGSDFSKCAAGATAGLTSVPDLHLLGVTPSPEPVH